ncbi:MAG: hypothetical protein ABI700_18600, partial [Chloroflexota bacterium]
THQCLAGVFEAAPADGTFVKSVTLRATENCRLTRLSNQKKRRSPLGDRRFFVLRTLLKTG